MKKGLRGGIYNALLICFISGCSSSSRMESATLAITPNLYMEHELEMLGKGFDFVAFAGDSSWSLQIDLDKEIIFKSDAITGLSTAVPEPEKTPDGKVLRYTSSSDVGGLIVEIQTTACKNDVTGLELPYAVVVQAKKASDKIYTTSKGCGHYLVDYRLHDIWVLKELNTRSITPDDYTKEPPRMELNTRDGKLIGFTGCNNFFGSLLTRGNKITFAELGSTKMFCEKSVETEYLKTLGEVQRFEIKDLYLTLYTGDTPIARFLKVD